MSFHDTDTAGPADKQISHLPVLVKSVLNTVAEVLRIHITLDDKADTVVLDHICVGFKMLLEVVADLFDQRMILFKAQNGTDALGIVGNKQKDPHTPRTCKMLSDRDRERAACQKSGCSVNSLVGVLKHDEDDQACTCRSKTCDKQVFEHKLSYHARHVYDDEDVDRCSRSAMHPLAVREDIDDRDDHNKECESVQNEHALSLMIIQILIEIEPKPQNR